MRLNAICYITVVLLLSASHAEGHGGGAFHHGGEFHFHGGGGAAGGAAVHVGGGAVVTTSSGGGGGSAVSVPRHTDFSAQRAHLFARAQSFANNLVGAGVGCGDCGVGGIGGFGPVGADLGPVGGAEGNMVASTEGYSGGYAPDPVGSEIAPLEIGGNCWVRRPGYQPSGAYLGPVLVNMCRSSTNRVTVSAGQAVPRSTPQNERKGHE
jgi:hypothetical protein